MKYRFLEVRPLPYLQRGTNTKCRPDKKEYSYNSLKGKNGPYFVFLCILVWSPKADLFLSKGVNSRFTCSLRLNIIQAQPFWRLLSVHSFLSLMFIIFGSFLLADNLWTILCRIQKCISIQERKCCCGPFRVRLIWETLIISPKIFEVPCKLLDTILSGWRAP